MRNKTIRHYPIPTRSLKIRKLDNMNAQRDVVHRSAFELLVGVWIGTIILDIYVTICHENKYTLLLGLNICSQRNSHTSPRGDMYKDVHHKVIYGRESWKQSKYPSQGRMDKYDLMEYYAEIRSNKLHKYTVI